MPIGPCGVRKRTDLKTVFWPSNRRRRSLRRSGCRSGGSRPGSAAGLEVGDTYLLGVESKDREAESLETGQVAGLVSWGREAGQT